MQKIRAEIHLGNIRRNVEYFSALTKTPLCAVVKANAYGHGAEEVAAAISDLVDFFAVALVEEGLAIRTAACGKPILVFTPPTDAEEAYLLAVNGFTASIPDLYTARLLVDCCQKHRLSINAHLKVNTGMNRYGMNPSALGKVCKLLQNNPYVKVTGLYTHLCEYTLERAKEQRERFLAAQRVCKRYFPSFISHLGGTYAAMLGEEFVFDMTRIGIGLYGYLPTGEPCSALKKGMTVKGKRICNRSISYGSLGYGTALSSSELEMVKSRGVTLYRVGYGDGFLRNRHNGLKECERFPNELAMDTCFKIGKKRRGQLEEIITDAEQTAKTAGTISYEVLCAATRRAECVYDTE